MIWKFDDEALLMCDQKQFEVCPYFIFAVTVSENILT